MDRGSEHVGERVFRLGPVAREWELSKLDVFNSVADDGEEAASGNVVHLHECCGVVGSLDREAVILITVEIEQEHPDAATNHGIGRRRCQANVSVSSQRRRSSADVGVSLARRGYAPAWCEECLRERSCGHWVRLRF